MQAHSRRIGILGAASIVAVAVLATGAPANTKTPTSTQSVQAPQAAKLVSIQSEGDGGETYVWTVNGVQRGMAFR